MWGRFICAAAMLAMASSAPTAETKSKPRLPAAEIWYTEQFVMHSRITGRDYLIQVSKPMVAKGKKAPAIYLLDGNLDFGIAEGIMGPDGAVGSMEPAFIIGIGYPGATKAQWLDRRATELLFASPPSGKPAADAIIGDKFARFLTEELRPAIETRYPADPHHAILAGQSYGGLFAANMLLRRASAFDGYIIGSPTIFAEPAILDAADRFTAPRRLPVFIGVGANEDLGAMDTYGMVKGATALKDRLADRDANLDLHFWIVPGENHFTVTAPMFERAFQLILPPRPH